MVLSCADSRVPPEFIFNTGLGDLFVVRTAGEVVDRSILATLEYGAEHLHIPLLVVMGHESCGAVKAVVDKAEVAGPNLAYMVKAIRAGTTRSAAEQTEIKAAILANVEQVDQRRPRGKRNPSARGGRRQAPGRRRLLSAREWTGDVLRTRGRPCGWLGCRMAGRRRRTSSAMGRPLQFLAFGMLILTAAARAAAQSHGKEPVHANTGRARGAGAPSRPPRRHMPPASKPASAAAHPPPPAPASKPAWRRGAGISRKARHPQPASAPAPAPSEPAPAATARAVAKALTAGPPERPAWFASARRPRFLPRGAGWSSGRSPISGSR